MTARRSSVLVLVLVLVIAFAGIARAQGANAATLARLIEAQGVSGFEADVRSVLRDGLPAGVQAREDSIGNLAVTIGQGKPHLLVATSMDEDGYLVSDITAAGYLRLQRVSAGATHPLYDQFLYGQPVIIRKTDGGLVPGACMTVSAHLQRGRTQATAVKGLDDLWVDVGARSRAEVDKLGVKMLDTVTLRDRVQALGNDRVAGVAAQARSSALALLELARAAAASRAFKGTLTVAWTSQGAFGDRGLARLARQLDPDKVVIVTRATVNKDTDAKGTFGTPGGGPVVFQGAPQEKAGGATAATLQPPRVAGLPAGWVARTKLVSLPVQFAQTPVETVVLSDVTALARLLVSEAGVQELAPATPAKSARATRPNGVPPSGTFRFLSPLIDAYGVSGHETEVREAVARQLPKWATPAVDAKGNMTLTFGQGGRQLLFVAHTDELGYEIVDIRDDGTASVRRGGVFNSAMEAHPVLVHTARGRVAAIVAPRPNYLRATEWQPRPEEIAIYFGTDSRQATEALGVKKGDTVTVRKQLALLAGGRATSRAIDDRAGCAALTMALEKIDPARVRNRVTFAWDVEEETGLVGAGVLAERLQPDYVFAVDTFVSSDTPIDPQRMALIPLGSGAVLRAVDSSSITPPETVAQVQKLAAARGIPVTVGVTSGGNDGSQFGKVGATLLPLSWPGRYSHSAVEVIDGHDLEALVDLIVTLANEMK